MSYSNTGFDWAESEISKLAPQLTGIGVQLATPLGVRLGVTAANATYWQRGAAVVVYANARLTAIRSYSVALTNWRDNFLLDRTPEPLILPELTLPPIPAPVQAALDDPNFLTDFLHWCDKQIGVMEEHSLTDADRTQIGLLIPPPPTPKDQLQCAIRSVHEHPHGAIEVNVDRKNQAQVKVVVTLDDGAVQEKTLPSAKIPFTLPTDRVHSFSAVAQYADKFGAVYGLASAPKAGRSEL